MLIGVPKEIKNNEFRVGLTPRSVKVLIKEGHDIFIETNAGIGSGFYDKNYIDSGATILECAEEIFKKADLIVKVKEPQLSEIKLLKDEQILFTYLHLASSQELTMQLLDSNCISFAYETITSETKGLPLLTPMSEIAGRLSVQAGAKCLEKHSGGQGVLLGGSSYSEPAQTLIIGGGVVGYNAALIADGMMSKITILEKSPDRIEFLKKEFPKATVLNIDNIIIEEILPDFNLVIGAVLIPGSQAPKIIKKKHLKYLKPASVLVDVAIDQGGCFETSIPTTHDQPSYLVDNIIHYCVANMPGAVPRTSTISLNNVTLPYVVNLANLGVSEFCRVSDHNFNGLNTYKGKLTYKPVSEVFNIPFINPRELI
tara:strand:- start:79 stop:1188 length:1110 start_codon:yes stop_codon:yes gene_type:complete